MPANLYRRYVYDEDYNGKKLSEVINETHENPKYLPGVELPPNIIANPDLIKTVSRSHDKQRSSAQHHAED